MMHKNVRVVAWVAALALASWVGSTWAKSAGELLQEGIYAEDIEGDLGKAIQIFDQVIATDSSGRSYIAQAMYRKGTCFLKKRDEGSARATFEKLLAEFADQTAIIEKAKTALEDLTITDPAALMPADTLAYVEIGSPGRQIETLLAMLKGTPLENPLAAMAKKATGQSQGAQAASQVMSALFNPSMLAEFKKIRGMAVGLAGAPTQNNPPMVAVLYPGQSDALRGMIMAGLGMVGRPGEAIEGLQTLRLGDSAGAAYDDKVIIVGQPWDLLVQAAKRYRGTLNSPSLATNADFFARVSKKVRQDNALTWWVRADAVFAMISKMMPNNPQILMAKTFLDPEHMDQIMAFVSLRPDGISLDTSVDFKPGQRCLAYNLFRTPNLTKEGFVCLPGNAFALVTFALSGVGDQTIDGLRGPLQGLTGLDFGREVFANIEQVTLFAMPTTIEGKGVDPVLGVARHAGLAITSHNPQRTGQLLRQVLGVGNAMAQSMGQPSASKEGAIEQYLIPGQAGKSIACYFGQTGKATVISLDRQVVQSALEAQSKDKPAQSPLQRPLASLTPQTSKLVAINAGGAIRAATVYLKLRYQNPENPAYPIIEQLAQAFDKTTLVLTSEETDTRHADHVGINDLPPLDKVFGLGMQLARCDMTAQATAVQPQPTDGGTVPPGPVALQWKAGVNGETHKVYFGTDLNNLALLGQTSRTDSSELKLPEIKPDGKYAWRVDEQWKDGKVVAGPVWRFSVGRLLGYWKLDETGGTVAADSSGNGNNGTLKGNPTWQPSGGKVGGALQFHGNNDFVEITNESAFDITGQVTVAAWIKVNQFDKEWQTIVAKGDSAWRIQRDRDTDGLEFGCSGVQVPGGGEWGGMPGKAHVNDGQWHHVAGAYDGTSMRLYVDGALDVSQPASGRIRTNDQPVSIGCNSERPDRLWSGLIDDVRVYSYALAEAEIKKMVAETQAGK